MLYLSTPLTRETVIGWVQEEDILFRYTGVPVVWRGNEQSTAYFPSPFRTDRHPSCVYFRAVNRQKIYLFDHTTKEKWDCIDVAQKALGTASFTDTLHAILADFGIGMDRVASLPPPIPRTDYSLVNVLPKQIQVKRRAWTTADDTYWNRHGVSRHTLTLYDVAPVVNVWVEGRCIYGETQADPAYAFRHAPGEYKVYFPQRRRGGPRSRWLSNGYWTFGIPQLPETAPALVLTKSLKDTMLLFQHGIPSIPRPSEGKAFPADVLDRVRHRFSRLFSFCDWDRAGCHSMWLDRSLYNAQVLALTTGWLSEVDYGAKDISDFHALYGAELTTTLIASTRRHFGI